MGNFKEDIAVVEALVFDVDGVFTDGGVVPLPGGDFLRRYNAKDCHAVARAIEAGLRVAVITKGSGALIEEMFATMRVTAFYGGCRDKTVHLKEFTADHGLLPQQVL